MLSKKYYKRFAQMLLRARGAAYHEESLFAIAEVEKEMMNFLAYDNPNFSREKFLEASGGDDE